jgi:hypothetical protein
MKIPNEIRDDSKRETIVKRRLMGGFLTRINEQAYRPGTALSQTVQLRWA